MVAPGIWVALVVGTKVLITAGGGRETARPVPAIALVIGAKVSVVTYDALAKILAAHAGYTDTRSAVPVAGTTLVPWKVLATTLETIALILGTLVVVIAIDVYARVLFADTVSAAARLAGAAAVTFHPSALRVRGADTIDTKAERTIVVIVVVTNPRGRGRTKVATTNSGVAIVVCTLVLVVAVLRVLAFLTAPNQRHHAQRADT
jgi:hypothetical protein